MLQWQRCGHGPDVVLVHGFLGSGAIFDSLTTHLQQQFCVTTIDLPGHGNSRDAPVPATIEQLSEVVVDTIHASGLHSCAILGHSLGAMIALEISLQHPILLEKMILYGGCPDGYLPQRFETTADSIDKIRERGIASVGADIAVQWFALGAADPSYDRAVAAGQHTDEKAAIAHIKTWDPWHARDRLVAVLTPTLVICGDSDRSTHPDLAIEMWRKIPAAQLFIAPGAGHIVHLEYPEEFNSTVARFLLAHR